MLYVSWREIVGGHQLGENSQGNQLHAHGQERRRINEQWASADRFRMGLEPLPNPEDRQVSQAERSQTEKHQADRSQNVQRPLIESGQESNGEQVKESFHQTADSIFRITMSARPMIDDQFADAKPSGVRQDRDEPVEFAVDADLLRNLRGDRP